jgi:hypothetical protein
MKTPPSGFGPGCARALVALVLFVGSSGCAVHRFAVGTVSYTSSPPIAGDSGALPLRALVCADVHARTRVFAVKLGDSCTLAGPPEVVAEGKYGPRDTLASFDTVGDCAVPTREGSAIPLKVTTATFAGRGSVVDLVVAGTSTDGRYYTYRFTGHLAEDDDSDACDRILNAPRPRRYITVPADEAAEWFPTPPRR